MAISKSVLCSCGKQAVVVTSWTNKNPGRRFYACPNQVSDCKFIGWVDPQMCQRAMDIIPGLLRSKNQVEEQLEAKECEVKKFKIMLLLSSIVIGYLVFLLVI